MSWDCAYSQNQNCPCCRGMQTGLSNCLATKNPDLTKEWHPTLNGDLTPYDVTCGSNKKVWWQCSKNSKHVWKREISIREKSGCPYCAGQKATDENNLLKFNSNLCKEWNYNKNKKRPEEYTPNSGQKVWWKCKECEHEWRASINSRNGKYHSGCPKCNESKGEKKIKEICKIFNIPYDSEFTFDNLRGVNGGLLRFDVPIFWDKEKTQLRILIEFDGIQHFEWQKGWQLKKDFKILQKHDKLKTEYCKINNIKLLRIKYDQINNIEQILYNELFNTISDLKEIN
jgi:hypothetical protein